MPRRKTKPATLPQEPLEELIEDLKTADEEIGAVAVAQPNTPEAAAAETQEERVNWTRADLLQLSEDGVISKSVAYIKKASAKALEKIEKEYEN